MVIDGCESFGGESHSELYGLREEFEVRVKRVWVIRGKMEI